MPAASTATTSNSYPAGGVGGMGNQTPDAALFHTDPAARRSDNGTVAWLARYTLRRPPQTYEIGLGQKPRSPNLYERYARSTWQTAGS